MNISHINFHIFYIGGFITNLWRWIISFDGNWSVSRKLVADTTEQLCTFWLDIWTKVCSVWAVGYANWVYIVIIRLYYSYTVTSWLLKWYPMVENQVIYVVVENLMPLYHLSWSIWGSCEHNSMKLCSHCTLYEDRGVKKPRHLALTSLSKTINPKPLKLCSTKVYTYPVPTYSEYSSKLCPS